MMSTGQERDPELGLDYFHARSYGAALGRFTSPDPENAGADPLHPQSWNGYAYVTNSPLVYTDPSGKCFFSELFGFLLAPETGGASLALTVIGAAVDTGLLLDKTLSHGGGHSAGSASAPAGVPASGNAGSLPPGSFPGGETAGLPPGMSLPGPLSPQVLYGLGAGWNCSTGVCVPGYDGISFTAANNGTLGQNTGLATILVPNAIFAFGRIKGERGLTGTSNATNNPTKKARPLRDNNGKIIGWLVKDPVTGKDIKKSLAWGQANGLDASKFAIGAVGAVGTGALLIDILEGIGLGVLAF